MDEEKQIIVGSGPMAMWIATLLAKRGIKPIIIAGLDKDNAGLHSGHQWHLTGCICPHQVDTLKWYKLPFLHWSKYPVSYSTEILKFKTLLPTFKWYVNYIKYSLKKNYAMQATNLLQLLGARSREIINKFSLSVPCKILTPANRWSIVCDLNRYNKNLAEARYLQGLIDIPVTIVSPKIAEQDLGIPLSNKVIKLIKYENEGRISSNWRNMLATEIIKLGGEIIADANLSQAKISKSGNITHLLISKDKMNIEIAVTKKPIVAAGVNCYEIAKNVFLDSSTDTFLSKPESILPVAGLTTLFKFKQGYCKPNAIVMWQDHFVHLSKYEQEDQDINILTVGAIPGTKYTYTQKQVNYRDYFLQSCFASEIEILHEEACVGRPLSFSGHPHMCETSNAIYVSGLGYNGMTIAPAVAEILLLKYFDRQKNEVFESFFRMMMC